MQRQKPKVFRTHRLVAQAFIPNPNGYKEINHIDENKINNNVENLEWCTRKYNCSYGKINESKIKKVIQYDKNGNYIKEWNSITEAQNKLGIAHSSIVNNCRNKRHSAGGFIWTYKK